MGKLLSKLGGTKRRNQLEKWKDGEESIWSFTVGEVEVNRQLLKRKFQVEQQLKMETTKRRKLEIEARELRNMTKSQSKVMSQLLRNADCCSQKSRGSSSKHWNSYSRQQRNSKRKAYAQNIKAATSCCEGHFKPLSMEIENIDTGNREIIDLESGSFSSKPVGPQIADCSKIQFAL